MECNHNFVFSKGRFECTKCGQIRKRKSAETKKKTAIGLTILAVLGIVVGFFASGVLEINEDNLDNTIQNLPKEIKNVGSSAKELASETTIIFRQTVGQQIGPVQLKPLERLVDDIEQIPEFVKENNPLNEKPEVDQLQLELMVHQLTNEQREQFELPPLNLDEKLSEVARNHSKDMANRSYFSHVTPEGLDPTARGNLLDYECEKVIGNLIYKGIAENILQNNLYDSVTFVAGVGASYEWNTQEEIANTTVDGWMHSEGHRKNILSENFDREGIGVWIADDDKVYITQNFC